MRSLLEQTTAGLRSFYEQRDDLIFVLQAADGDMPAALKIIEALDDQLAHVWGWVFAMPFAAGPGPYAEAVVADIAAKHAAMNVMLRKNGREPWPPLPIALSDENRDPAAKLRVAVVYVRSLVPPVAGGVTVFALVPLQMDDPASYGQLATELVRHQTPFPWCARVRFVLRDDPRRPVLAALAASPRARALRSDFSPGALSAALAREAADEALPEERRMAAAIVAAGMDQAHGRTAEALARYEAALDHYGHAGNAAMAALAAHGIAASKQAQGDLAGAERIWLAAFEAGLQADPPALPVLLNVLLDLVMLVARQRRWVEAEAYLVALADIAHVLFMPSVEAEAQERRGVAQLRQGKLTEAERSWRDAIATADKAGETERAIAARTHLRDLLARRLGREDEAQRLASEIERLRRPGAHTRSAGAHV